MTYGSYFPAGGNIKNATILVTEVDTLPGFYTARQFVAQRQWGQVLCAVNDKNNELSQTIAKEGGKVIEYNPSNPQTLERLFAQADALVLTPPLEENAVQKVRNIIQALKNIGAPVIESDQYEFVYAGGQGKGPRVLGLVSCLLAQFAQGGNQNPGATLSTPEVTQHWLEIEEVVRDSAPSAPILRSGFPLQYFFYLSNVIQNKGMLPLSTGNGQWAPINFNDFAMAMYRCMTDMYEHMSGNPTPTNPTLAMCFAYDSKCRGYCAATDVPHHGQTYTLTGVELLTGQQISQLASQSLDARITFQEVNEEEMRSILEQTGQLSQFEVDEFVAGCEIIKENKVAFTTSDLQKLIRKRPSNVATFFKENARNFKPRFY